MKRYNKHIIIVGSARSGTSWLSETIAQQHRYRMLFEPEQETRTKKGHLLCDQWIETSSESPEAHAYLKQVFANRVDCDWIAQNSNRVFKRHLWPLIPKKYVIKFVRANLMAKYMNTHFEIPVIHMIRNPYEVIQSQLQVNFPWLTDLSRFANQPQLAALINERFQIDITDTSKFSKVQLNTLRWCIENVVPLEVLKPISDDYAVIRYEDLFSNIQEFYDLCTRFNLEPISNIELMYRQPSTKTHPMSTIITKKEKQSVLSESDVMAINDVLKAFQTKLYPIKHQD